MAPVKRQMHLGVFWLGAGNHSAGWRYEGAWSSNSSWPLVAAGAQIGLTTWYPHITHSYPPGAKADEIQGL